MYKKKKRNQNIYIENFAKYLSPIEVERILFKLKETKTRQNNVLKILFYLKKYKIIFVNSIIHIDVQYIRHYLYLQ